MSLETTAKQFVDRCNQGRGFAVTAALIVAAAALGTPGCMQPKTSGTAERMGTLPAAARRAEAAPAPVFDVTIPPGYRDWRLISVAHEKGDLNDIRAILGNDVAIAAYREGRLPFPDGTIIARLAWEFTASEENDAVFGQAQSFVAGKPVNGLQFMVKDSSKYASTGGWGFGHFEDGKPADTATLETCVACHAKIARERDQVFTRWSR